MGYYNYQHGHVPRFKDMDKYKGQWVSPQAWPEDLAYADKSVLVIGSGATAVTLVPALAKKAERVTLLQRSPSYIISLPKIDAFAKKVKKILPAGFAYKTIRLKNIFMGLYIYRQAKKHPLQVRQYLQNMAQEELGADFNIDPHFIPSYNPWDQRLCRVPDGDLFKALKSGAARIVTDHVDRFTKTGVLLKSGARLDADIIVPATGLKLQFLGGADLCVDGKKINPADMVSYKGMMFSDVPNFTAIFGYTNATWTLKADLTANYVARLLGYMDKYGYKSVCPVLGTSDMKLAPIVDLKSGYITRAVQDLPKQGSKTPWRNRGNYLLDYIAIKWGGFNDGVLKYK